MKKNSREPLIIAIGGGKGGVGKSMLSSNLAVCYAQANLHTVLIDLDVGAANLHTIFGIRQPPKGLGDYFTTQRSQLSDYIIETQVPGLHLIPGSGFVPELANLKHAQKAKIISHLKNLNADLVLLDLGAGSSSNVIDFFSMTHAGIVVTTPEPTAIINAYEFLKNVVYRILFRMFKNQADILDVLKASTLPNSPLGTIPDLIAAVEKTNKWAAQNMRDICADLDFYVVFNQSRKVNDTHLGIKLHEICRKYLNLDLTFSGMIFFNEEVSTSVFKMCPISLVNPKGITSQTLQRIGKSILQQVTDKLLTNKQKNTLEEQISCSLKHAQKDFELNLLAQSQLHREQYRSLQSMPIKVNKD